MLIVQSLSKGAQILIKYPKIGCKFLGPAEYLDTQAGNMWVCLPKLSADEERIQKALLKNKLSGKQFAIVDLKVKV